MKIVPFQNSKFRNHIQANCFIITFFCLCLLVLCCAQSLSHGQHFVTPWTVARQALWSMGIVHARILKWVAYPFSRGSSGPRNQTEGLLHCRQILYQLSYQGSPQLPGELCVGSRQIKMSLKSCLPEKKKPLNYLIIYIWGRKL